MSIEIRTKEKIISLQALRTLSFLGIFLHHAGAPWCWPALGVSVFFVMSGFLMVYTYYDIDMSISIRDNLKFSISKIKKLYPLHIITMCFAVLLRLARYLYHGISIKNIIGLVGKIGLNVTLMQTWIPYSDINVSLNGVAWYLSVTLFLYFMFPYIKKWIKPMKKESVISVSVIILFIQVITCIPLLYFLGNDNKIYIWFMYCFPIFRLGDFFVGCSMGKIYFENLIFNCHRGNCPKTQKSILKMEDSIQSDSLRGGIIWSIIEIVFTAITVVIKIGPFNIDFFPLIAAHNRTTRYIPLAAGWVYLFTINKGIITKLFNNRAFVFLGDISAYMFLIHFVITRYTSCLLELLNLSLDGVAKACVIIAELIETVALSLIYMRICKLHSGGHRLIHPEN